MKTIDILYFDACPGWRGAVERIRQVVSEGGLGDVDGRLEGLPPTGWFRKALGVPDGASAPSPAAAPCCGGATPRE